MSLVDFFKGLYHENRICLFYYVRLDVVCDTFHHSQIKTLFPVHPDHLLKHTTCSSRQTRCDDFSNKSFSSPQLIVKILHNINRNMFDGAGFLSRSTEIDIYQSRKCPTTCCSIGCFGQNPAYVQFFFFYCIISNKQLIFTQKHLKSSLNLYEYITSYFYIQI